MSEKLIRTLRDHVKKVDHIRMSTKYLEQTWGKDFYRREGWILVFRGIRVEIDESVNDFEIVSV